MNGASRHGDLLEIAAVAYRQEVVGMDQSDGIGSVSQPVEGVVTTRPSGADQLTWIVLAVLVRVEEHSNAGYSRLAWAIVAVVSRVLENSAGDLAELDVDEILSGHVAAIDKRRDACLVRRRPVVEDFECTGGVVTRHKVRQTVAVQIVERKREAT